MTKDPCEEIIAEGLDKLGVVYQRNVKFRDERTHNVYELDFFLPFYGIWIEVCQFYTPRKLRQMNHNANVILIQGRMAATQFIRLIRLAPEG